MSKSRQRISTYEKNIKKALDKLSKEITLSEASRIIIAKAIKYYINYNDEIALTDLFKDESIQ